MNWKFWKKKEKERKAIWEIFIHYIDGYYNIETEFNDKAIKKAYSKLKKDLKKKGEFLEVYNSEDYSLIKKDKITAITVSKSWRYK